MGWCYISPSSNEGCDEEACKEIGGKYDPKPGICFLLSVLDDERAVLMASTLMYPAMIQFRDQVLSPYPVGQRMLAYFKRFYNEAIDIARRDPKLINDVVWLSVYAGPFLRAALGERVDPGSAGHTPTTYYAERLRPSVIQLTKSVIRRFRAKASSDFKDALDDFNSELARLTNLTPADVIVSLRRSE